VLDEIGRGTSTFDGLSIAWAVAEYLTTNQRARPKTLFATHYHELTDLADALPGIVNYHVAVRDWQGDIVFLRKILPGRSDRSYGIHVARLAGLPSVVVARAGEILVALEQDELARGGRPSVTHTAHEPQQQLGLFSFGAPREPVAERRLHDVDEHAGTSRAGPPLELGVSVTGRECPHCRRSGSAGAAPSCRGGVDRRDPADVGEGGFGSDPLGNADRNRSRRCGLSRS